MTDTKDPGACCADCAHYGSAPLLDSGQCRFNPPVPLVLPAAKGLQVVAMYPPVHAKAPACGHFRARTATSTIQTASANTQQT